MGKRIGELDGIRALAILAIFLHHSLQLKLLWAGVDLFFIVSGFLITGILLEEKQRGLGDYFAHFYGRRVRRILPPYLLLLMVTCCLIGFQWLHHWYLYLFFMNALVAFQISHPPSLDLLWSLAVEEQFYMAWPFVIYYLSEAGIGWTAVGLFIAAPVLRGLCTPLFQHHWQIYSLTPFRMDLLAMGAILALAWRKKRSVIERYGMFGPLLSIAAICLLLLLSRRSNFYTYSNNRQSNIWIYELTLVAATGVILWALGGRFVAPLNWAPVRYLGRISYSIYLIHLTVILLIGSYAKNSFVVCALSAGVIVLYAAASWRFLERPILYWKKGSKTRLNAEMDQAAIVRSERAGAHNR